MKTKRAPSQKARKPRKKLDETEYLMRSPANARRLLESIAEFEQGKFVCKKLSDLIDE